MVRTRLNIGCRYSTPVLERPLHPTRSQFKPEPSQTQAPVTPATEPERRAGGGLTTAQRLDELTHWLDLLTPDRAGGPTGPIWTPPGGKGRFGAPGEPGCSSISGLFVQACARWP